MPIGHLYVFFEEMSIQILCLFLNQVIWIFWLLSCRSFLYYLNINPLTCMVWKYVLTFKTVWYCHKNRHINQWNRIESPEINPSTYSQMVFNNCAKNREKSVSWTECWENWISTCQRMKLDPVLHHTQKINSKWIKYLNIRPRTVKLLEENIGETFHDIGLGNDFLDMTPKAQTTKAKLHKWVYIRLTKELLYSREIINRMKRQPTEWASISYSRNSFCP